jgi:pimeloyl-ACP methyl ester carboxylesterase
MRARFVLPGLALLLGASAVAAPTAGAAIAWAPCTPAGYQCGQLAVPLDPTGATAGTVTLAVKRAVAATNPTGTAVIGLAGGPGQAAIPFAQKIATNVAPALGTRDLIVYDQRGTGQSGQLRCFAFSSPGGTLGGAARSCANEIGPRRAFYRTSETVEDIEAIRREGGYAKLVLYGTSYGTKVAEAYAARYPANVEALVLDSVVLPEGPDVFGISSFRSVGPILRQMCGTTRCRGISGDPRGDIAALVRQVERSPLRGPVTTSSGATARRTLGAVDLVDILFAGDFDPTLRADLPAAVRSALRGDVRPILRLEARASGDGTNDGSISPALFTTTTCEEAALPWTRTDSVDTRAVDAIRAARAIPRAQLGPFDARVALAASILPLCVSWPNAGPAPVPQAPVPAVPTLIVSGGADVRTPQRDARALAARIAGAQLLEVPFVGHSTIGADTSGCAHAGVAAFLAGQPVPPCTATAPQFAPTRIAPTRLGNVPGAGRSRKTVRAVEETLQDVGELYLGIAAHRRKAPRIGTRVGGLRGGNARWTATGIRLRGVQYVPGVVVSGLAPHARNATTRVTVSGPAGAHGMVRILPGGRVAARLDGRRLTAHLPATGIVAAARAATLAARARGYVAGPTSLRGSRR